MRLFEIRHDLVGLKNGRPSVKKFYVAADGTVNQKRFY